MQTPSQHIPFRIYDRLGLHPKLEVNAVGIYLAYAFTANPTPSVTAEDSHTLIS